MIHIKKLWITNLYNMTLKLDVRFHILRAKLISIIGFYLWCRLLELKERKKETFIYNITNVWLKIQIINFKDSQYINC